MPRIKFILMLAILLAPMSARALAQGAALATDAKAPLQNQPKATIYDCAFIPREKSMDADTQKLNCTPEVTYSETNPNPDLKPEPYPQGTDISKLFQDPLGNLLVGDRATSAVINASQDKQTATLTLSQQFARHESLFITFTSPVASGSNTPTVVADQSGLSNLTTVAIGFSKLGLSDNVKLSDEDEKAKQAVCNKYYNSIGNPVSDHPCTLAVFSAEAAKAADPKTKKDANPLAKDWLTNYIAVVYQHQLLPSYSLSFKQGANQYSYFDQNGQKQTFSGPEPPRSITAAFALLDVNQSAPAAVSIGYTHEISYKEKAAETVCQPVTTSSTSFAQCSTLPFGQPIDQDFEVYTVSLRAIPKWHLLEGSAYAVNYSRNLANKGTDSGEFLAYLARDSSQNYTGGLRAGWSSTAPNSVVYSIFVGTPFSFE